MLVSVTKVFEISYAHHLQDYVGKCKNVHGHNAKIELEFGDHNFIELWRDAHDKHEQNSGMVLDFSEIKKNAEAIISEAMDHKNLNELPYFKEVRPTAENMCLYILHLLARNYPSLIRIRVWEDCDSYAEWRQ